MAITNEEMSALFDRMAIMLEMKGESIFKIRAYKRAAQVIDQLPYNLQHKAADGSDLRSIPSVGKAISSKIIEYMTTGRVSAYERLKSEFEVILNEKAKIKMDKALNKFEEPTPIGTSK